VGGVGDAAQPRVLRWGVRAAAPLGLLFALALSAPARAEPSFYQRMVARLRGRSHEAPKSLPAPTLWARYRPLFVGEQTEKKWGRRVGGLFGNGSVYRGMHLPGDGAALREIAERGFELRKVKSYRVHFFSLDPAVSFAFTVNGGPTPEPEYYVVFQVNPTSLNLKDERTRGLISERDVPASAIEKIYVYDPAAPARFPFRVFTPAELLSASTSPD
jgi:hypothetical protein